MEPNNSTPANTTLVIIALLSALASAVGVYILLTYLIPDPHTANREGLRLLIAGNQLLGALAFVFGLSFLRLRLERCQGPAQVLRTVIIAAAFGDAIGVFGLLEYFLIGNRNWALFGASIAYFAIMFLALPAIIRASNNRN